jgi:hypothetical protein
MFCPPMGQVSLFGFNKSRGVTALYNIFVPPQGYVIRFKQQQEFVAGYITCLYPYHK